MIIELIIFLCYETLTLKFNNVKTPENRHIILYV